MNNFPESVRSAWHLVALSGDVRAGRPIARAAAGTPIALFRTEAGLHALVDRCPHRNFPLSDGQVVGGTLQCPYHGWRFAPDGSCSEVPGCVAPPEGGTRLSARPVRAVERYGGIFVNVSGAASDGPDLPPIPETDGHDHFWWSQGVWNCRAFDAVENVMDPFHTNFIHHGFIRRKDRRLPVALHVNGFARGIEMVIDQTQPDLGVMSRFLEGGERARSRTRYYPPTIVQARWEAPERLTLCVTAFFTPESDETIRPFACFTTPKGLAPSWLKQAAIRLFLTPVVRQDRIALERQNAVIRRFGAPRYTEGPGDLLGSRVQDLYDGASLTPGADDPRQVLL